MPRIGRLIPAALLCALASHVFAADVKFYGQLNPTFLSVDDGVSTTTTTSDNAAAPTRLGVYVRNTFGDVRFRFNFETALGLRKTSRRSQLEHPDLIDFDRTLIRKLEARFRGGFGTFTIGQGNMGSDGAATVDLSGTKPAAYASVSAPASRMLFTDAGTGLLTNVSVGGAFQNFDGVRLLRVRYETRRFAGFSLGVSAGTEVVEDDADQTARDIALRYRSKIAGIDMRGAVALNHSERPGQPDRRDAIGSFSLILPSGSSGTMALGNRDGGGWYHYVKYGYKTEIWPIGDTAFSVDYYRGDDIRASGSKSRSVGLAMVQTLDAYDTDLSVAVRNYDYSDQSGVSFNDMTAVTIGASWRF